jgi:hypothetical protein
MSKCIWICSKEPLPDNIDAKLFEICNKISPDNIDCAEPKVVVNGNVAFGIMNPTSTLLINGNNLLLGMIFDNNDNWKFPLKAFPDGSYALFREDEKYCEVVSDPVASRTIWYFMNDEIFIASTSQRAIILFIGGFEFNENVIPWMLANGTLGPLLSWDKRIRCLSPDSSLILEKKTWSVKTKINPIEFSENRNTDENHEKKLRGTLISTFDSIKLNFSNWILPLSGGYDSRGILCLLNKLNNNLEGLKLVTWGLKSSINEKENDAYIAKRLATEFNLHHKYYHTDLSEEPIEKVINRFLQAGEGRIDQLSGYIDGFKIWKTLYEEGIHGIIRGDEGFGCKHYSSISAARINQACGLCSDFSNLKDYHKFGIPAHELPTHLKQKDGETLSAYRDRLFHQHAFSTHFAALSDLKLSYVEVIKPLLSRTILQQVRQLPDHLRTNKLLFKKIVVSLSPNIPFATQGANSKLSDILKQKQVVELIVQELSSKEAKKLFSAEFLNYILKNITNSDKKNLDRANSSSHKELIRKIIPLFLKNAFRFKDSSIVNIDFNVLAFRIYIIVRMNNILMEKITN